MELIYLRKSRADNPNESVEQVLSKHEFLLQEWAYKNYGYRISESCIYREIVSGETIDERPMMCEILRLIERPSVTAVLCVDPQRLSRGDLADCGRIVNAFRYSGTRVVTLNMTYDLQDKMQRKFFEMELVRGNDYLEYTKEILHRGRIASVRKGNFIGGSAPYGYDKVRIDGAPSLMPNDKADIVRTIFEMYVIGGRTAGQIATWLDSSGVPAPKVSWSATTVQRILSNPHYTGQIAINRYTVDTVYRDGRPRKIKIFNGTEAELIPGHHPPIISDELYQASISKLRKAAHITHDRELQNPLAGMLFCADCGKAMQRSLAGKHAARYACVNRHCKNRSTEIWRVVSSLADQLEQQKLPEIFAQQQNRTGSAAKMRKLQLERLRKNMEALRKQEQKQYDMLEKEIYSEIVFTERHDALRRDMEQLRDTIAELETAIPKETDYNAMIVSVTEAIRMLRDDGISAEHRNRFLRTCIDRIEYRRTFYHKKGDFDMVIFLKNFYL